MLFRAILHFLKPSSPLFSCKGSHSQLYLQMKPLSIFILVCISLGCAEDTPPATEVRDQFRRGLSGQGQIVPLENPSQPGPSSPLQNPGEQPSPSPSPYHSQ
jgi:hypothetical protein